MYDGGTNSEIASVPELSSVAEAIPHNLNCIVEGGGGGEGGARGGCRR